MLEQTKTDVVEKPGHLADDPKIVAQVEETLKQFGDIDDMPRIPPVMDTPAEETPKADDTPVEKTPVAESKAGEAVADEAPTLPDAYRRTAKAREWTDAEIDRFYKQDAELAIRTFSKMHESRAKELGEWAELGRKARQQPASTPDAPARTAAPAVASEFKPVDIDALVEKFGNEELIRQLAGPLNAQLEAIKPLMEQAKLQQQMAARQQQEVLGKIVQDFFTGKPMERFKDVYGSDWASLTPDQNTARHKVLELADALAAGARLQGRNVTADEALQLAHDTVSKDKIETLVRDGIKKSVVQRQKGITLKPTNTGRVNQDAPPRNRRELEDKARSRLAEVFN